MALQFTISYLEDSLALFRYYKNLAERAMALVSDEQLSSVLDDEMNSIAIVVKHMAGNMRSRWTDFLTADGEKPERNRDMEFVIESQTTKDDVRAYWERGWQCLFAALEPLEPKDFDKTVLIRGEAHTIVQAVNRQMMHYAQHIGQIVLLAKHFRSSEWKSLSIPRNLSTEFNAYLAEKADEKSGTESRFDTVSSFASDSQRNKE